MKKLFLSIALMLLCVFGLFACGEPTPEMEAAAKYLDGMYLTGEVVDGAFKPTAQTTADDYSVISKVIGNGKVFDIKWSIEMISGNAEDVVITRGDKDTLIVINEKSEVEAKYYLVAVIEDGKVSIEKKYEKVKPAYRLMTWEEVQAAKDDTAINGAGVITGIVGTDKLNIYFENEQGGYYIYGYTPDAAIKDKIVVGATIEVSGTKDTYNGLVEFTSSTVVVSDEAVKEVAPKDVTEIFKAAKDTKATELTNLVSQYVTIKGVKMKDITSEGKYLNFTLAGKETYVYISSSSNMVTADEISALNEKVVKDVEADITGMVALYSGAFYIIPNTVNSIKLNLPELTDAEKVADAEAKVAELAKEKVYNDLDLFTKTIYPGVAISWVSANEELIAADGKLVASPAEDTEVKLTATITAGAETKVVEVTVTVAAVQKMTVAAVNKLFGEENTVCVEVKIIASYNNGKGSFVADATGAAYLYTKLPEGIAVGDSVKLIAKTTVWENSGKEYTRQLTTISIEKLDKEVEILAPSKVDLNEVVDKFGATDTMTEEEKAAAIASKYYGRLYEFTGYVVEHKFGDYTNYGLSLTADGATFVLYQYQNDLQKEFQALLGKKVTIVAPMYGYSAQYGWRIGTYLTAVEAGSEETTTLPTAKDSTADIWVLEKDTEVELIGQITAVYEGNGFFLEDGTGRVFVYVKGDTSAHKVGDIVKVAGKAGFYNGAQVTSPTVEKLQEGTYTPEYLELTVEEFLALEAEQANYGKEVVIKGTVVKSSDGKYVNLQVAENKTANLYMSEEAKATLGALDGKAVEITGVLYNKGKYPFNVIYVAHKEVAE